MTRFLVLFLLTAAPIIAGPHNPGLSTGDVVDLWSSQTVDTSGVTPTDSYPVGLDGKVTLDFNLPNLNPGSAVTFTALYELPGGNLGGAAKALNGQSPIVITVQDPDFEELDLPNGPGKLLFSAITDDTDGVSVSISISGR